MLNPYAIYIHCDGAMIYDKHQTGGNGFIIEFPDDFKIEPITRSIRNDNQGIHRLEMISILEALEELIFLSRKENFNLHKASGVIIYTDRIGVTDQFISPYRIQEYKKNKWLTHEGKAVKNSDLLEKLYQARIKLSKLIRGRIEVHYKKEKNNKVADKLSRIGRSTFNRGRKIVSIKMRRVSQRMFDGPEVEYSLLNKMSNLYVNVYAWEVIRNQVEIDADIISGKHKGKKVSIYLKLNEKNQVHRKHQYRIKILEVCKNHINGFFLKEKPIKN